MAKRTSPVDEIAALVPPAVPRSWEHRVAEEHRQTLEEIKAGYLAGRFGTSKFRACEAISNWLKANNIATIGRQGVEEWLAK